MFAQSFLLLGLFAVLSYAADSKNKHDTRGNKSDFKGKKHNIKEAQVIVCALLVNEEPYVDEWIRYYQYLGFDFMYLYDNSREPSPYMAGLSKVFGNFVRVKHLPGNYQQLVAYNDCFRTFKNRNTWAAMIDADEFLVLPKHPTIKQFLNEVAPKGGAVVFNWNYFSNSGIKKHEPGPVTARFTYCMKELNKHIKTISYLGHVRPPEHVHYNDVLPGYEKVDVQGRAVAPHEPVIFDNAGNKAFGYINHYHTKSLEELIQKKKRGRADMPLGGPIANMTEILEVFEEYNEPMHQVRDTFARDFYLRHFLGRTYDVLTQNNHEL